MTCRQWEQWIDDRLEGQPTPDWERHAAQCACCADHLRGADRVLHALQQQAALPVPTGLHARLTAAVAEDQRQLTARAWRGWARPVALLAAALLLAVGLRLWPRTASETTPLPQDPIVHQPVEPAPEKVPLRQSVHRAGQAMASLTVRTAGEAVETTSALLPMNAVEFPEVQMPPTPPVEPIRSAGQRVSAGLEPVTDSARRAMNLFWRDLPLTRRTPVE
jgi:hypothetical protein